MANDLEDPLLSHDIEECQPTDADLEAWTAISLGLTSLLKSVLDTQYTYRLSVLELKLRSGIMTIIYQKCLSVTLAQRAKFCEGEIQTFMSVDADRTLNLCNSFHDMWSLPLQIGLALYLLYTQVKFAFISGISITILLIPVNKWIAELIASASVKMMQQKDESAENAIKVAFKDYLAKKCKDATTATSEAIPGDNKDAQA